MGGYGTWMLGAHHADRVAALAASAGAPTPIIGPSGNYDDVTPGVVPNLRNVPFVIYQSDDDPQVPPAANRMAAKKLAEAQQRWGGFEFEYWEVPGRQHTEAPGGMPALLAKICARVRDPRPAHIVWQPVLDWKPQFYWLWWAHPRRESLVEAELDREKNEIRIRGDPHPEKFEVLLDERMLDLGREVRILLNEKEVFRAKPELRLATLAKTALAGDEELSFAASVEIVP
jgi:pimeloyl-ACP methyl ester carboxylesterase